METLVNPSSPKRFKVKHAYPPSPSATSTAPLEFHAFWTSQHFMLAMAHDPVNDLIDGMENMGQMSFLGLHDIAIMQVMGKLDVHSLLAMRLVNKRMDKLHSQVKYLKRIYIRSVLELTTKSSNDRTNTIKFDNFDEIMNGLNGLAIYSVGHIYASYNAICNISVERWVDTLLTFEADKLELRYGNLPQLTLSTVLTLANNIRRVEILGYDHSLTVPDLHILRKRMCESGCKMEYLYLRVERELSKSFLKECFGVTYDMDDNAHTTTFRTMNKSVELYCYPYDFPSTVQHFEGNLHTEVHPIFFTITKRNGDFNLCDKYEKIKLNRVYAWSN